MKVNKGNKTTVSSHLFSELWGSANQQKYTPAIVKGSHDDKNNEDFDDDLADIDFVITVIMIMWLWWTKIEIYMNYSSISDETILKLKSWKYKFVWCWCEGIFIK